MHEIGITLIGNARVESTSDLLPILRTVLLLGNHRDRVGNVKESRLVVLSHQTGDISDEVRLEGHGLLDVAVLVVNDGTVKAGSGELFNLELRDEVTSTENCKKWVNFAALAFKKDLRVAYPHEGSCLPVTGMIGSSGRVLRM